MISQRMSNAPRVLDKYNLGGAASFREAISRVSVIFSGFFCWNDSCSHRLRLTALGAGYERSDGSRSNFILSLRPASRSTGRSLGAYGFHFQPDSQKSLNRQNLHIGRRSRRSRSSLRSRRTEFISSNIPCAAGRPGFRRPYTTVGCVLCQCGHVAGGKAR